MAPISILCWPFWQLIIRIRFNLTIILSIVSIMCPYTIVGFFVKLPFWSVLIKVIFIFALKGGILLRVVWLVLTAYKLIIRVTFLKFEPWCLSRLWTQSCLVYISFFCLWLLLRISLTHLYAGEVWNWYGLWLKITLCKFFNRLALILVKQKIGWFWLWLVVLESKIISTVRYALARIISL